MPSAKPVPILRARIEKGRVVWAGIDGKKWNTAKHWLEGKDVEITIQPKRKKRSLKENAYMWAVVVPRIAHAAGYRNTEEEHQIVHDGLREKFLSVPCEGPLKKIRSTTSLSTVEMEEYLDSCRQFAAEEYGIYIPLPNEIETE